MSRNGSSRMGSGGSEPPDSDEGGERTVEGGERTVEGGERATGGDGSTPTRRELLRATGATAATATATALAGCSGTREETFEASPVSLSEEAGRFGYVFEDANTSEITRERSGGGQTVKVTIISHVAAYDHVEDTEGSPFLAQPSVGAVGTPAAEVLGQEMNPAATKSLFDLLQSEEGKRFLRGLDVDASGWSQGPRELGSTQVTMLDEQTQAKTFIGVTNNGDLALINAARVRVENDAVLAGDARTREFQGEGSPDEAIKGGVQEEARAAFAEEVAPYIVREEPGELSGGDGGARAYDVVENGLTREEADALRSELVERFGADPELIEFSEGIVSYLDEANYKRVPGKEVPADEVGLEMPQEAERRPDTFPAIDRAAIRELPDPPNQDAAASDLMAALESAGVSPRGRFEGGEGNDSIGVTVSSRQPVVELFDTDGEKQLERPIDTVVDVKTTLNGAELVGSGSKIHASFGTVDGERRLTEFRYAHPRLEAGEEVEVVDFGSGDRSIVDGVYSDPVPWLESDPELSGRQVYYSPPLDRSTDNPVGEGTFRPKRLFPQYLVGGTVPGNGEVPDVELLETVVPAVEGGMVPEASVDVEVDGRELVASAEIDGGQPPYRLEWSAGAMTDVPSSADGEPANVTIELNPREAIDRTTVTLEVVDANGVGTVTNTDVDVSVEGSVADPSPEVPAGTGGPPSVDARAASSDADTGRAGAADAGTIGGVADFGVESPVGGKFGKGVVRNLKGTALEKRFSYWDEMAWERDYRDPSGPKAYDEKYGDNADFQWYTGHGNPAGFAFKDSDHEDGFFHYSAGNRDWGDFDAEWIALWSCSIMKPDVPSSHPQGPCGACDGKSVINRWGDNFDGLHMMLGFQVAAKFYPGNPVFGKRFARRLENGQSIVSAWLWTIHNHQANTNAPKGFIGRGRIIAPYGPNGVTGKDDHIWGNGRVAPDIPKSRIRGWWVIRGG